MNQCIATIQEGHKAEGLKEKLAAELRRIAGMSFEGNDLEVKWKVIPRGYGWTGGKPSSTSVLLCVVPEALPFKARAEFMHRVNDMWIDKTRAHASELLIVTHGSTL